MKRSSLAVLLVIPAVYALLLCLAAELLNQSSPGTVSSWIVNSPHLAALNVAAYLSLVWMAILITNRVAMGCVLSTLVLVLPMISSIKRSFLLLPLLPADLKLVGQMFGLLGKYGMLLAMVPALLGALGLLVAIGYTLRKSVRASFSWPTRVGGSVLALLVLGGICYQPSLEADPVALLSSGRTQDLSQSYRERGFAMAFGSQAADIARSGGPYSQNAVTRVVSSLQTGQLPAAPEVAPDIIAILSESMWDPTQLPGVRFSRDPIPNLRRLQKEGVGLEFLSPAFGGGTANIEFELLTGFSTSSMPEGSFPFVEPALHDSRPSIVRYFAAQGYRTVGLHNHTGSFWHRNKVYPNLGFEEFYAAEDFTDAPVSGEFIADAYLGKRMAQELERSGDRPTFLFAVTMQNHGAYRPGRYRRIDVKVDSATLGKQDLGQLQSYTQGIYETDAMLGRLTEFLKQRGRPAIVIYFGDHLPAITTEFELQKQTGLVKGSDSAEDRLKLHTTPAVIWASYPVPLKYDEKAISAGLIWPELLQAMGQEHAFYTRFLDRVRREVPGLSHNVFVDATGRAMLQPPTSAHPILRDYWLLQHDLLEGKRYSMAELFPAHAATTAASEATVAGGAIRRP